jgi:hypothetical protein
MMQSRRAHLRALSGAVAGVALRRTGRAANLLAYTDAQQEKFLAAGKIVSLMEIGHGVTKPVKAELEWEGARHAGSFQVVDKEMPDFFPPGGGKPIPMKDSWRYNVAAYRMDRLIGLNMVAVTVPRPLRGKAGAISWWVDDVKFEEAERIKKDIQPPDPEAFNRQRALSRVFDELIINIDRNYANLLITNSWKLVLIDHSRSFVAYGGIRNEANLTRCSRGLMESMKGLTTGAATRAADAFLTAGQVQALLARRDRIVEFFEKAAREKGESNVLFG